MAELFHANKQWATRPADERFWTPEDALAYCRGYATTAQEPVIDFGTEALTIAPNGEDMVLTLDQGKGNRVATMTNWAFAQLAATAKAPTDYLRGLPTALAIQCLEHGLDRHFHGRTDMTRQGLIHANGATVLRSLTSTVYSRFWNWQVFERLVDLHSKGWKVPPARPTSANNPQARPATRADVLTFGKPGDGIAVKVGDPIAPAGIYASDHDMFAFLVNEDLRTDDGTDGGLSRGFFIQNSEVGASALRVTLFDYRSVCGNHIVWGAEDVMEISVRHVGDVGGKFSVELAQKVDEYANRSAKDDKARIKRAKATILGADESEVLDAVFKAISRTRKTGLPSGLNQKVLAAALETAKTHEDTDGNPFSVWGYVNGLTRISQATSYADERNFLDRTATSILALAL